MAGVPTPITLLSGDVRSKVHSAHEIRSHRHIIEELVKNALDAQAQLLIVHIDFASGYCCVEDDGIGIPSSEFASSGHLAKLHCTSKYGSTTTTYGRYGRFLSNLSFLSLLSITSRNRNEQSAQSIVFHRGQVVHRGLNQSTQELDTGFGTKVTVQNLFGDIPVRVKQRASRFGSSSEVEKEFNSVKDDLVSFLLSHAGTFCVRLIHNNSRYRFICNPTGHPVQSALSLPRITSILYQAGAFISSDTDNWRLASVRAAKFSIRAAICLCPSASKLVQYISVGDCPLQRDGNVADIFAVVNQIFDASTFGNKGHLLFSDCLESGTTSVSCTKRPARVASKGVERWPAFYVRIDPKNFDLTEGLARGEHTAETNMLWTRITSALRSLLVHFLEANGFTHYLQDQKRLPREAVDPEAVVCSKGNLVAASTQAGAHRTIEGGSLAFWQRIKNVRQLGSEEVIYGLPFRQPRENSKHHTEKFYLPDGSKSIDREQPDPVDVAPVPRSRDVLLDQTKRAYAHAETAEASISNDNKAVLWENPLNGRIIQFHPRTGAELGEAAQLVSLRDILKRAGPICPRSSVSSLQKGANIRTASGQLGWDKYLQKQCHEAPIPLADNEDASALKSVHGPVTSGFTDICLDERISKVSLAMANILGQVDQKFILVSLPVSDLNSLTSAESLLVLIDQHAADERVQYEILCKELCGSESVSLRQPIVFEVDEQETQLFISAASHFRKWHIDIDFQQKSDPMNRSRHGKSSNGSQTSIQVRSLPGLIAERCRTEPKLLIDLLRNEIWSLQSGNKRTSLPLEARGETSWLSDIAHCPSGLLEMLKSRSCRSALMFNDRLSMEECQKLVQALSQCAFPFQCAHGRPSSITLTRTGSIFGSAGITRGTSQMAFAEAWQRWKASDG